METLFSSVSMFNLFLSEKDLVPFEGKEYVCRVAKQLLMATFSSVSMFNLFLSREKHHTSRSENKSLSFKLVSLRRRRTTSGLNPVPFQHIRLMIKKRVPLFFAGLFFVLCFRNITQFFLSSLPCHGKIKQESYSL